MKKVLLVIAMLAMPGLSANAQWVHTSLDSSTIMTITTNGNDVIAGGNGVFVSSNNGDNWNATSLTNTAVYSLVLNGNNIFAGTAYSNSGVLLSIDNGNSWVPVNNGLPANNSIRSLATNGNIIVAGIEDSGVFLSTNNGQLWTSVNDSLIALDIVIKDSNIFVGTDKGVFLSPNNGVSWMAVNNGLPLSVAVSKLAISGNNIFACDFSGGGVFMSSNNGGNWVAKNNGLPSYHIVRTIAINNKFIFAGLDSFGVWRLPLSELSAGFEEMNNHERNIQVYPNPATNHITVETCSEGIITISTIQGQLIKTTATSGSKTNVDPVGYSSYVVDVSALPSGVYLVEVRTETGVAVKKFIKE